MAHRRMFSNRIANSARFLQMPVESQLLYFHMVLRADDDGIVESYPLMKLLGVASDNFKVLLAKKFIRELNEDQVIVITDWLEHNTIRADRKVDSIYKPLLLEKFPETPVIVPKPRSDVEDNSKRVHGQSTGGISKDRLGKVKLNTIQPAPNAGGKEIGRLIDKFKTVNPSYKNFFNRVPQRKALERLIALQGIEKLEAIIDALPQTNLIKYFPVITTPIQLEENLGKLLFASKKDASQGIQSL